MDPALSQAMAAPPRSSLWIFLLRALSTTGGPAAKSWEEPLTMTEKWDITARPAGPPAVEPKIAEATGTIPRSCQERS